MRAVGAMSIRDDPRQFEDGDEPWRVVAVFNRWIRPTLTTDTMAATAGFNIVIVRINARCREGPLIQGCLRYRKLQRKFPYRPGQAGRRASAAQGCWRIP
jgi:hypothetical protein